MPTPALRVIAGFLMGERYAMIRGRAIPSEALQKQIFPFIEGEMENVEAAILRDDKERPTAICTLRLWTKLRTIILQDAAAMFVLHPERKSHCLFGMPVFRSDDFKVSRLSFLFDCRVYFVV